MKINTYPQGGFGNISYNFMAAFTVDDFQGMHLLRENEGDRDALVRFLSRFADLGYQVYRYTGMWPVRGTFTYTVFVPESAEERTLYMRNEYQIEALISLANRYSAEFVQKFYDGEFLRDNTRVQTFTYPLSAKNPMDRVFTEVPYTAPVSDWKPTPEMLQTMQNASATQYVPVTPYTPQV
jgi:hypothetical protein